MLITYPHVEDYLEYLAGYEVGITALIMPNVTKISLARYDIQIVNSMANSTTFGTALTEKQAELAVKLVLKYRRQFAKLGIDVTPVENPQFRIPVRKLDTTKAVWIEDDRIMVKFPYNDQLIKELHTYRNEQSQGRVFFDRDAKRWQFAITEPNVNWLYTWADMIGFDIALEVKELFDKIITAEQQPHEIKLVHDNSKYTITNAAKSLVEYIENQLGGFGLDNKIRLVDYSGLGGYTVDDSILATCPQAMHYISTKHAVHVQPSPDNLNMIYDYAEQTDRYPVCIYNPTLIDIDLSRFEDSDIVRFDRNGKTNTSEYDPYGVKVIYAQKIPKTWEWPVPLMVTTFEMMFGGKKMDWSRRAEKIIYYGASQLRED
jgi:hypothetical protein